MTYSTKQKVLIIDSVFAPSKKDRIMNGVQKFTKAQRDVLSDFYEVHYVTSKGSDVQYSNQYVLSDIQNVNLSDNEKRNITKSIKKDLSNILDKVNPDIVLDSSCKHFSSLFPKYKTGIVFDHYHSPSMPLTAAIKDKFTKNKIFWCGVSKWQHIRWNSIFDGITSVHMLEKEEEVIQPENFGVFVGRWDIGKSPHIAISRYARYVKDYPLHIFTSFKNCFLGQKDRELVSKLMDCDNLIFHVNAPRNDMINYMKRARFILGGGNESTGIVSLEGASFGVPYIVTGTNSVAEQEHMHPDAMVLLNRSNNNVADQLIQAVNKFKNYDIEQRKFIAKDIYSRYNRMSFQTRQLKLIKKAKNLYGI